MQRGTRVRLLVSTGPEQVTVPDVVGLSRTRPSRGSATRASDVTVEEEESDEPEGEVISQDPAGGARVERGATVTITVSTGRPQVERAQRGRA